MPHCRASTMPPYSVIHWKVQAGGIRAGEARASVMAILITGIGYIGARLLQDLLAAGEEVVAIDNLFATDPGAVRALSRHPNCHFIEGSFGHRAVLARAFRNRRIDTVYALAAQSSPYHGAASVRYTEHANMLAPRQLLDAMLRNGVRSIVFASSLKVYGAEGDAETAEDANYGTMRDFSHLSKCYVEKLIEMYAALHGMRCISARLAIVYGLSPVMKTEYRFMTAPNKFCRQLALGEPLELYPGSERLAGFIHIDDACAALRSIAGHTRFHGYCPVNVATEWATVPELAALATDLASRRGLAGAPAAVPTLRQAIGGRLAATGFRPNRDLAHGLAEVLDYFVGERRQPEVAVKVSDAR